MGRELFSRCHWEETSLISEFPCVYINPCQFLKNITTSTPSSVCYLHKSLSFKTEEFRANIMKDL